MQRRHMSTLDQLQRLAPEEFDRLVADLWERQGWETEVRLEPGENDVGIEAWKDEPGDLTQIIQTPGQRSDTQISESRIRKFDRLGNEMGADRVLIVTTQQFTEEAKALTDDRDLKTINGEELAGLIDALNAHDLIEKYLPPDSLDAIQESGSTPPSDEAVQQKQQVTDTGGLLRLGAGRNRFGRLVTATLFQAGVAIGLYIDDTFHGFSPVESIVIVYVIGVLVALYVFLDANRQHILDRSYQPNRVAWPVLVLVMPIIPAVIYGIRRAIN